MALLKRNLIALTAVAALAGAGLAGCGSSTGTPTPDGGVIKGLSQSIGPDFFDEQVKTQAKPDDGWVSAPWALGKAASAKSNNIEIMYVAGDAFCYGPAGFTLQESGNKVTIGAYVKKVADSVEVTPDSADKKAKPSSSPCPSSPAGAVKYGTVVLKEPLGDRELIHAGLDNVFEGFQWNPYADVEKFSTAPSDAAKPSDKATADPAESPAESPAEDNK